MSARSIHIGAILLSGSMMLAGCSSMGGQQTAQSEGSQVGEAAGQEAGSHAAKNMPYVGGMVGGILGRHAGAEAGKAAVGDHESAQPAAAKTQAGQ